MQECTKCGVMLNEEEIEYPLGRAGECDHCTRANEPFWQGVAWAIVIVILISVGMIGLYYSMNAAWML